MLLITDMQIVYRDAQKYKQRMWMSCEEIRRSRLALVEATLKAVRHTDAMAENDQQRVSVCVSVCACAYVCACTYGVFVCVCVCVCVTIISPRL